jgi:DNA-binding NarL/FixJ family response regulator
MAELRIVIADDHELLRRGLRGVLEAHSGWQVVGEAANGREAVELVRRLSPQVVVLDISMPEMNGLEATREILREFPGVQILVMTLHESEDLVREVLAAGARGYLLKSDAAQNLVRAVDAVSSQGTFFTPKVASMVVQGYVGNQPGAAAPPAGTATLTPRERQVTQLLAEGKTNKEVADILGISVKTAEAHRANIMNKLGLASLSELVRWAIRNRLTEA